jgi:hypothetical protein
MQLISKLKKVVGGSAGNSSNVSEASPIATDNSFDHEWKSEKFSIRKVHLIIYSQNSRKRNASVLGARQRGLQNSKVS